MVKMGSNVHRSKRENQYYMNECRSRGYHTWTQISRKGNHIEFQCRHCGIMGHANVRKYK